MGFNLISCRGNTMGFSKCRFKQEISEYVKIKWQGFQEKKRANH